MERKEQALQELEQMQSDSAEIVALRQEKARLLEEVSQKAKALSEYRMQTLDRFIQEVTAQLTFLNMPNVVLVGKHTTGKLTIHGMDTLEFLISANQGEEPRPLAKIASGGELSRIMLALKCVIADRDQIPTLIFDEIDTGISGRTAQKVSERLACIAKKRQVIAITHLPQIAAMADAHYLIEKTSDSNSTISNIYLLTEEESIKELARMLGGVRITDAVLQNAREMRTLAKQ